MLDVVLATRNPGKVVEIQQLLEGLPVRMHSLTSFQEVPEVVEDRPTLEENAIKKAVEIAEFVHMPTIADDTGLEIAALDGQPGVHSARFAGPEADPVANRALLLKKMAGVQDRSASFRTVIAFSEGDDVCLFEGTCRGRIANAEHGEGGFGYDALFIPDGEHRTFAELSSEEKNAVSHRGRALREFASFLSSRLQDSPD